MRADFTAFYHAIEKMASISEENTATVENVSATATEENAQVEEVTAIAQSLAEMARRSRR